MDTGSTMELLYGVANIPSVSKTESNLRAGCCAPKRVPGWPGASDSGAHVVSRKSRWRDNVVQDCRSVFRRSMAERTAPHRTVETLALPSTHPGFRGYCHVHHRYRR